MSSRLMLLVALLATVPAYASPTPAQVRYAQLGEPAQLKILRRMPR